MSAINRVDRIVEIASCDSARAAWFAAAVAGSSMADTPDDQMLADIVSEREVVRQCEGGGACTALVTDTLETIYGWPTFHGVYLSASGEPVARHSWNILPDGAVLDATADQFGVHADRLIVRPDDKDWGRYRREWTAEYNPSLAAAFPELADCLWSGETDEQAFIRHRLIFGDEAWWLAARDRGRLEAFLSRQSEYAAMTRGPAPGQR